MQATKGYMPTRMANYGEGRLGRSQPYLCRVDFVYIGVCDE